jgi:hypothetical protein
MDTTEQAGYQRSLAGMTNSDLLDTLELTTRREAELGDCWPALVAIRTELLARMES